MRARGGPRWAGLGGKIRTECGQCWT
jgi:hypothetical protein